MTRTLSLVALLACGACTPRLVRPQAAPLVNEGEVLVYVQPFSDTASRLSFTISAIAAERGAGPAIPLELAAQKLSGATPWQQALARGRLPPGRYDGLALAVSGAALAGGDGPSTLLVSPEPYRPQGGFEVERGKVTVLWLSIRSEEPLQGAYAFSPSLTIARAPRTIPQMIGLSTSPDDNVAVVFDKHARVVTGAIATGRRPTGLALSQDGSRAFIALAGEDAIQQVDLEGPAPLPPIRLHAGDGPTELVLAPDGRTLLVVNQRSNTLAFVDTSAQAEVARVNTGEEPWSVVVDRSGRRAFVLCRRAGTVVVVDLGTKTAVRSLATDAAPVRAAVDRANSRLYVVSEGSAYMTVYTLPGLAVDRRLMVGLGATYVKVDPRTDLIYVARGNEARVAVFDPLSLFPISAIETLAPVTYMAIDDLESVMFLLMANRGSVAALDLTSRRTQAVLEMGNEPFSVVLAGERH